MISIISLTYGDPPCKCLFNDSVLTAFRIRLLYDTTGSPLFPRITGVTIPTVAPLGELDGALGELGLLGTLEPKVAIRPTLSNAPLMTGLPPPRIDTFWELACCPGRIGLAVCKQNNN